nr:ATPase, F1/V1/A1 complex, alpha/beta subunit, zinc knuckle CX2CX4HX4C [Tanacetum cinerariifolium]
MVCVTSASYSVCVKGGIQGWFQGKRGLRQDELFLFARGYPNSLVVIMDALEEFKNVSGMDVIPPRLVDAVILSQRLIWLLGLSRGYYLLLVTFKFKKVSPHACVLLDIWNIPISRFFNEAVSSGSSGSFDPFVLLLDGEKFTWFREMEDGFLLGKDASKKGGLAFKVKNIEGKLIVKDGVGIDGTNKSGVHVSVLTNDVKVVGANVNIPCAVVDEVSVKFANTLYGYFIGEHLTFPTVEAYVTNAWAKYGFQRAIFHNGFLFFKFTSHEGMVKTLEGGPWFIRSIPIFLNIWEANTMLKMEDITRGEGHYLEVLDVEYDWWPPRCSKCKMFDHEDDFCPSLVKKVASVSIAGKVNGSDSGLKVKQMIGNNAAKKNGFRFSKPKNNLIYRLVSKPITPKADTSEMNINVPPVKEVINEATSQPCVPHVVITHDCSCSINENGYSNDDIDIGQIRSNIEKLMDEEKYLNLILMRCRPMVVLVEAKGNEKESLLEQFRKSNEASSSKLNSISDSKESKVEEVCMPECLPGGGLLDDLEDDLDCFDGYEA